MIKLTRTGDGEAIYISAALVSAVEPDIRADATEVCVGNFTHIVTESSAEVARLVAEVQRPAAGVDLEAVATARRLLARISEVGEAEWVDVDDLSAAIDDVMDTEGATWRETADTLRALAARLGGTP